MNIVAYCSGGFGPGNLTTDRISDVQKSGFTSLMLWSLHIGRPSVPGQQYGDLVFNDGDIRIVVNGVFNPDQSQPIEQWPNDLAQLKQNGSSVSKIFFSIGGDSRFVEDFRSIEYMLNNGMADQLKANFQALRDAFTVDGTCLINGIDLDNEEMVQPSTIVTFSEMMFDLGFEVTFCPFNSPTVWQGYMQQLWNNGYKVSWWNLQCYSGGFPNNNSMQLWINALSNVVGSENAAAYIVAGYAVKGATDSNPQLCPKGINSICSSLSKFAHLGLGGGFIWKYDDILTNTTACTNNQIPTSADYVQAIADGLNGHCK